MSLSFRFSALLPGVCASSAAAKEAQLGRQDLGMSMGRNSLEFNAIWGDVMLNLGEHHPAS